MTYSLPDKITNYLASKSIANAKFDGTMITIPIEGDGAFVRSLSGVINRDKLDAIAREYQSEVNGNSD